MRSQQTHNQGLCQLFFDLAQHMSHLAWKMSLYLGSSGSNTRGESRVLEGRHVSSKALQDEGAAGRNRWGIVFTRQGVIDLPPRQISDFLPICPHPPIFDCLCCDACDKVSCDWKSLYVFTALYRTWSWAETSTLPSGSMCRTTSPTATTSTGG